MAAVPAAPCHACGKPLRDRPAGNLSVSRRSVSRTVTWSFFPGRLFCDAVGDRSKHACRCGELKLATSSVFPAVPADAAVSRRQNPINDKSIFPRIQHCPPFCLSPPEHQNLHTRLLQPPVVVPMFASGHCAPQPRSSCTTVWGTYDMWMFQGSRAWSQWGVVHRSCVLLVCRKFWFLQQAVENQGGNLHGGGR
jgi:hypothetical protein